MVEYVVGAVFAWDELQDFGHWLIVRNIDIGAEVNVAEWTGVRISIGAFLNCLNSEVDLVDSEENVLAWFELVSCFVDVVAENVDYSWVLQDYTSVWCDYRRFR